MNYALIKSIDPDGRDMNVFAALCSPAIWWRVSRRRPPSRLGPLCPKTSQCAGRSPNSRLRTFL
ncbi:MAG: hypothetical protein K2L00_09480 [Muribaculaceae bacterium]|nr:hypothetical protein [Muribaculaceae bacterium]